ncbi:MAPEG family protein [Pararhizobium sp. O133]|uniref:MAPEG family protein n=1 Tax=Pararhizobium sp. O133 TaxID=3449278 RepID=UPI003F685AC7
MPTSTAIFWPVIAQVMLVFCIYLLMMRRRFGAVRAGTAKAHDYKIPTIEPSPSATVARNLINQFELPLLFYLVCVLLYVTAGVSQAVVIIAWLFVLSRLAHAYVHVTSNRLMVRQRLFVVGFVLNFVLWMFFAAHLAMM